MTAAFIGLGSNLGDSQRNLLAAWKKLGETAGIELQELSSPYSSEPVGMASPHWFTNAVGRIETGIGTGALLEIMFKIEAGMGRVRKDSEKDRPRDRSLDLDLLYYGDTVMNTPGLVLPHPEIENRVFVLAPLAELAPDHCHPVLGLSAAEMLGRLSVRAGEEDRQAINKTVWPDRLMK